MSISEPIISFVETFKANPKRFKVYRVKGYDSQRMYRVLHFVLADNLEKISWNFDIKSVVRGGYIDMSVAPKWLTQAEADYIYFQLKPYWLERDNRIRNKRHERRKRKLEKEREALKKVYCK